MTGRDLPRWYREADVFCLLSIEEGLALVLLQAMAMGLPVIATPNTGAEDLIEDGVHGFIVPARDSEAAAPRLQQLADAPELRRQMGARARARVAEGFGWADYGARARAHLRANRSSVSRRRMSMRRRRERPHCRYDDLLWATAASFVPPRAGLSVSYFDEAPYLRPLARSWRTRLSIGFSVGARRPPGH